MAKGRTVPAAVPAASAVLTEDYPLACGRLARFTMPDMLAFAAGDIDIPNLAQADVYTLLYGKDGPVLTDVDLINGDRRRTRGLYVLFSLVAIDPATDAPLLCLDDEERQAGQLSPRQLTWADLGATYSFFRFGPTFTPAPAAPAGSGASPDAALPGDGVPPAAE